MGATLFVNIKNFRDWDSKIIKTNFQKTTQKARLQRHCLWHDKVKSCVNIRWPRLLHLIILFLLSKHSLSSFFGDCVHNWHFVASLASCRFGAIGDSRPHAINRSGVNSGNKFLCKHVIRLVYQRRCSWKPLIIYHWEPFRWTKKVKMKSRKISFVTPRYNQDQPFLPSPFSWEISHPRKKAQNWEIIFENIQTMINQKIVFFPSEGVKWIIFMFPTRCLVV